MDHLTKSYPPGWTPSPLRVYRVAKGLTQAELAQLAGVSRPTVIYLEARRQNPLPSTAEALAEVLGTSVEEIFPPEESA